jgi:hypothetical protein
MNPLTRNRRGLLLELLLLIAAAAVALALTLVSPPGKPPPLRFTPTALGRQPAGAVVLGREDKDLALGLAVQPQTSKLTLVATIFGQNGAGTPNLKVSFQTTMADGTTLEGRGRPCTAGCYETTLDTGKRPLAATVTVIGPGSTGKPLRFSLPRAWPPPRAMNLVREAEHTYAQLKTLVTHERLASSPTNVVNTTYQSAAPNRLAYQIAGGSDAIIIGDRRWDRDRAGGKWRRSSQTPLRQPVPVWTSAADAHLIGTTHIGGRSAWLVSFYDRHIPAFFTIAVERKTFRTLDLHMTAAAHFMHQRYTDFDKLVTIAPPPDAERMRVAR